MVCNLIVTLLITMTNGQIGFKEFALPKADLPKAEAEVKKANASPEQLAVVGIKSFSIEDVATLPDFDCVTGKPL